MNNNTFNLDKSQLIEQSFVQMDTHLQVTHYSAAQKLALTCRILFDNGHDSGLAGQITARGEKPGTYLTQRLGLGFDEICASNLLLVNEDLEVLQGDGMANPANRFHSWLYRADNADWLKQKHKSIGNLWVARPCCAKFFLMTNNPGVLLIFAACQALLLQVCFFIVIPKKINPACYDP